MAITAEPAWQRQRQMCATKAAKGERRGHLILWLRTWGFAGERNQIEYL